MDAPDSILITKLPSGMGIDFNLQNNVDTAIKEGHPNPKLLQEIADIITKDAPSEVFCQMSF